jgi:hypothetical protein
MCHHVYLISWGTVMLIFCPGWLWTTVLPISASHKWSNIKCL